jgi:hypothetical protein
MKIIIVLSLCLLGIIVLMSVPDFYGKPLAIFILIVIALGAAALDRIGNRWL